MKRELGIGRCGLACALCSENSTCKGCNSRQCPGTKWCQSYACSKVSSLSHCYLCQKDDCRKGLLQKIKPVLSTSLSRDTEKKSFWTAWRGTRRTELPVTVRE